MKTAPYCFAIVLTLALTVAAQDTAPPEADRHLVVVCEVSGMIDRGISVVVQRAVDEARELEADAIAFVVDTPGGLVDAAIDISKSILEAPCPTIAYIEGMGAISAGALISYACDHIVMTRDTNMGAATPVLATPQGMAETNEKTVSFMRAKMRALAEAKGHNPAIAEAMVDKDIELRMVTNPDGSTTVYSVDHGAGDGELETVPPNRSDDAMKDAIDTLLPEGVPNPLDREFELPVQDGELDQDDEETAAGREPGTGVFRDGSELILARGKLLTVTPSEALRYGIIEFTADSLDEALITLSYEDAEKHRIEPNWAEAVFRFITSPTISGLLLMLGLGGLYLEVRTPGFGIPGIIGITSLFLLFGAHYILGLAEWGDILLIVIGVGLILVEIFVLPGFGIAGVGGMICVLVGLYLSMTNFTIPQYTWEYERLADVAWSFTVALVLTILMAVFTWKFLPRFSLFDSAFVLGQSQQVDAGFVVQTIQDESNVGLEGVAASLLRPAGKGRFGTRTLQVVSRGQYIVEGTPIRIIRVEGNRYVVDPVEAAQQADEENA